jgi:hypothetical protein
MSAQRFDQLLSIYRCMAFVPGSREGSLAIADEAQLQTLLMVLGDEREFGLVLTDVREPDELAVGDTVQLRADDPRVGLGLLADDMGHLLRFPKARLEEKRFYLLAPRYAYCDDQPPECVLRYRQALQLIKLLGESAAYLDKDAGELVFIDQGKLVIPLQYGASDLVALHGQCLDTLLARFVDDVHREQKLAILSASVYALCAGQAPTQRFAVLLTHLPDLLKQFDEGYRLFVADFSYDKIVDQMETAKLEDLAKIHKTFADVQSQILGIPVATIIVATQYKPTVTVDANFWVNTAVLLGVWIFSILAAFVLRNQQHTLDALDAEIRRKKNKVEQEYSAIQSSVAGVFTALENRLKTQRRAFCAVDLILLVGFLAANIA